MLEEGYHLINDYGSGHFLDKLGHVGSRLSSNHWCVVVNKKAELLAELLLERRADLLVGGGVQAAARNL